MIQALTMTNRTYGTMAKSMPHRSSVLCYCPVSVLAVHFFLVVVGRWRHSDCNDSVRHVLPSPLHIFLHACPHFVRRRCELCSSSSSSPLPGFCGIFHPPFCTFSLQFAPSPWSMSSAGLLSQLSTDKHRASVPVAHPWRSSLTRAVST